MQDPYVFCFASVGFCFPSYVAVLIMFATALGVIPVIQGSPTDSPTNKGVPNSIHRPDTNHRIIVLLVRGRRRAAPGAKVATGKGQHE